MRDDRPMWTMRALSGLVILALLAGCSDDTNGGLPPAGPVASAVTAAPSIPASPSFATPADPGREACRTVQAIKKHGYRARLDDVSRAGELGGRSSDSDVALKARVMGDFASAASVSIQTGGDPAEAAAQVRGLLDELLVACRQAGFLQK
jgi:hypothetical protein